MVIMDKSAVFGEASQLRASILKPRKLPTVLNNPLELYRYIHIVEITTMEITEGRKNPALNIPFFFNRLLFNKRANKRAIPVVKGIVPTTKISVFPKAFKKTSS